MQEPLQPSAAVAEPTQQALLQLLQPLAHLMIAQGVQLPAAVELLKAALVQAVEHGFVVAGRASSDSRVAILTGVHRKDVRRLRAQRTPPSAPAALMSVASQVVARWISDPRYLNPDNSARQLARTPRHAQPGEPVFSELAAEVSRDVGARALLDELLRLEVVALAAQTHVVLRKSAFVPAGGAHESLHFLAANVSDHLAAAVHNLQTGGTEPQLEQSAFSSDLSAAQAAELQHAARLLWQRALQQFLQKATVAEQRSQAVDGPKYRVRFGVYFHQALQPEAAAADLLVPAADQNFPNGA